MSLEDIKRSLTENPVPGSMERAKRAYEHLQLLRTIHGDDCNGRWVAIHLSDGHCDNRLYASKAEATRFQLHETQCAYFCMSGDFQAVEVRFYLDFCERLYDAGFELSDPNSYLNPEAIL